MPACIEGFVLATTILFFLVFFIVLVKHVSLDIEIFSVQKCMSMIDILSEGIHIQFT